MILFTIFLQCALKFRDKTNTTYPSMYNVPNSIIDGRIINYYYYCTKKNNEVIWPLVVYLIIETLDFFIETCMLFVEKLHILRRARSISACYKERYHGGKQTWEIGRSSIKTRWYVGKLMNSHKLNGEDTRNILLNENVCQIEPAIHSSERL